MTAISALTVLDWGRTDYAEATERQLAHVRQRLAGEVGDTLIFTEHEPVFTLGLRAGADQHLVWGEADRRSAGIQLAHTNRGGDITYHGPGQIVGYPIVDLAPRKDLHAYLRFLEDMMIAAVARFGLAATRREGLTGIWIGQRKIAAIGVAVRRWVAYHGFALNVCPDLTHFAGIIPCGIRPTTGSVTSMAAELGGRASVAEVKTAVAHAFQEAWPVFLAGGKIRS